MVSRDRLVFVMPYAQAAWQCPQDNVRRPANSTGIVFGYTPLRCRASHYAHHFINACDAPPDVRRHGDSCGGRVMSAPCPTLWPHVAVRPSMFEQVFAICAVAGEFRTWARRSVCRTDRALGIGQSSSGPCRHSVSFESECFQFRIYLLAMAGS